MQLAVASNDNNTHESKSMNPVVCILVVAAVVAQLTLIWLMLFGGARIGRRRFSAERRGQRDGR
jgi:hypothetical protein